MIQNQTTGTSAPLDPATGPIHNTEIEKSVLATLMISESAVSEIGDVLTPDCFYDSANREVYEAIVSLYNQGLFPDMMLVSSELGKMGSSVSAIEVTKLCVSSPLLMDLHPHALILRDYALRRKLWETGYRLMTQASDESHPVASIHQEAKEKLDAFYDQTETELPTLQVVYRDLQERMLLNMNMQEGETRGTPTGFPEIDRNGGLCEGDLIVVGAETSQGKTSFATALAMSALEHSDGVAFYSLEMTSIQLTARIASMKSGISSTRILNQKMTIEEIYHVDGCMEGVDTSKMYFDEHSTSSLDSILLSIRAMKMKHDIKGAVVDYLQLVNTKDPKMNVEQMTAKCARDLKNLAKELGIWIVAISQLSRNQQNPVPSMSRLRNSGQIEEAADYIMLLYRPRDGQSNYPDPFQTQPTKGTALVMVEKARFAPPCRFICGFKGENTLFYPISEKELKELASRMTETGPGGSLADEDLPF